MVGQKFILFPNVGLQKGLVSSTTAWAQPQVFPSTSFSGLFFFWGGGEGRVAAPALITLTVSLFLPGL